MNLTFLWAALLTLQSGHLDFTVGRFSLDSLEIDGSKVKECCQGQAAVALSLPDCCHLRITPGPGPIDGARIRIEASRRVWIDDIRISAPSVIRSDLAEALPRLIDWKTSLTSFLQRNGEGPWSESPSDLKSN